MSQPTPKPHRTWLIVGLVLAATWVFYLFVFGPRQGGSGHLPPPRLAATGWAPPVDYGWTLYALDGSTVEFARFQGKPVFLNMWATWCPPCRDELPAIDNLASNPRLKGVSFVCVATDESGDVVKDFLEQTKLLKSHVAVLRATSLPPAFATDGIPATFIISPDGKLAAAPVVGSAQWDDPSVVDFLEKLATAKP